MGSEHRIPESVARGGAALPQSAAIPDWLFFHAARTPDAPAVASLTTRLSYGELASRVRILAGHLAARGVIPGSRVALALPNAPATVVAGLAVNALGATSVEVNRGWSAEILREIVAKGQVRHAFIWARDAPKWGAVSAEGRIDHVWGMHARMLPRSFEEALEGASTTLLFEDGRIDPSTEVSQRYPTTELSPSQPALILFTSGSTGKPHGVIQTFRNIEANTRSIAQVLSLTSGDRAMVTLPLHYCYGRSVLQTHLFVGGSIYLDDRMAFPRAVMETMGSEGCTGFAGVPLTFEIIRRQVDVSTVNLPRLRYLTQAGGAMARGTIDWVRTAFSPAKLFVMYGQTEATARLSYLPPDRAADKADSIGITIPGVELSIRDASGHDQAPGQVGELVARGDNVTPGYLDEPLETANILRDGWLWTGDLAYRDADGFFFHMGRTREILKIGGHRVSPVEIEQVIERHPDVAEAAVIGVSDALQGEVPWGVVVRRSGTTTTEREILEFCREWLPAYQVPRAMILVRALPRNDAGKLLRAELAAFYRATPSAT